MKLDKYILQQSALMVGLLFLFSCKGKDTPTAPVAEVKESKPAKPAAGFAFYKDITIKPGTHFEVASWGKGVDSLGGYLLLMTDSVKNNYRSLSVEREGIITDVWNMDLDNDGNPELYIELLSEKNKKDLNVYEFSGNSFNKISFPNLGPKSKKVYGGNDKFIIKNGDLFRSFPVVNSTDSTVQNGSEKLLVYRLRGNSFSVDEVSSTEVAQ